MDIIFFNTFLYNCYRFLYNYKILLFIKIEITSISSNALDEQIFKIFLE